MRQTEATRPWARSIILVGTQTIRYDEVAKGRIRPDDDAARNDAGHLAARLAVVAALAAPFTPELTEIDVGTDGDGGYLVELIGDLRRHADESGVVDTSLSVTHDERGASAVFVAVTDAPLPTVDLPPPPFDPHARLSDIFGSLPRFEAGFTDP